MIERLSRKIKTLDIVALKLEDFLKNKHIPSIVHESAKHLKSRVSNLKRSIFDAGTQYYLDEESWMNGDEDQMIMHELENATSEIGWQIQDMLRDTALHLVDFKIELPLELSEVIEQLSQIYVKKEATNVK